MTEAELHALLRRLADHCGTLLDDLDDSALPAASYSGNQGAAPKGGKSKPPVPITSLDYLVTDVEPRIRGWCQNLAADGTTGYPAGARVNILVAWLSRHRTALLATPWAHDCIDELVDLEAELRAKLYPTEPNYNLTTAQLPELITADQLCQAFDVQPATIRKWKERGKITPAGTQTLSTGDTIDLYRLT